MVDTQIFGPPPYPPAKKNEYIWDLPPVIQPWVEEIFDVDGDGHCGFRAVAFCLERGEGDYMEIRSEMIGELKKQREFYKKVNPFYTVEEHLKSLSAPSAGPCGEKYWMGMPGMGRAIANAFQRPVFFYSQLESQSFFPDFVGPNENRPITFAFISSKRHFVALTFTDINKIPVPKPVGFVQESFSEAHLAWRVKYQNCIDMYESNKNNKEFAEKLGQLKKEYENAKHKRDSIKQKRDSLIRND